MKTRKTKGRCRVCGGRIVEATESRPTRPREMIPIGPGSKDYYREVHVNFHCQDCQLVYHEVPPAVSEPAPKKQEHKRKTGKRSVVA